MTSKSWNMRLDLGNSRRMQYRTNENLSSNVLLIFTISVSNYIILVKCELHYDICDWKKFYCVERRWFAKGLGITNILHFDIYSKKLSVLVENYEFFIAGMSDLISQKISSIWYGMWNNFIAMVCISCSF